MIHTRETMWYVATDSKERLLCLSKDGFATDVIERVWTGNARDAQQLCAKQNSDKAWRAFGINWHYAPVFTLKDRLEGR